ncbi:Hypothetical protein, putative [Bodo saltans]|uniref:Flagellar attachment zone protein 1 conserved domain-containing protein n=1 Tax=Bodo saltans TaxID=75058 RepID=A0A0S4JXP7_BODSA|nr:Hypothetical protein, putative [Bodo saltans]|eukprot:CUG93357.1 Hypothetical protein, putative [Bodo saltans]
MSHSPETTSTRTHIVSHSITLTYSASSSQSLSSPMASESTSVAISTTVNRRLSHTNATSETTTRTGTATRSLSLKSTASHTAAFASTSQTETPSPTDSPTSTPVASLTRHTISITSMASTTLTPSVQPPSQMVTVDSQHVLRLSGTAWDTVLASHSDFVSTAVAIDIATALGIDRSRIQIDSLAVGSLVVTFTVLANSTTQQLNSDGVTRLIETQFLPSSTQFVYSVTSGTTESITLLETYAVVKPSSPAACGTGCAVGIALGCAAVAAFVGLAVVCYRRRREGSSVNKPTISGEPSALDQGQDNETNAHRDPEDFEPVQFPPTDPRRTDWLKYNGETAVVDIYDFPHDTPNGQAPFAPAFEMPISTRIVHDQHIPSTLDVVFRDEDNDEFTNTDEIMQASLTSSILHISGEERDDVVDSRSETPEGWTPRKYPAHTTPPAAATPRDGLGTAAQGVFVRRTDGGGLVGLDPAFIAQYSQAIVEPPTAQNRVRFAEDVAFEGADYATDATESWDDEASAHSHPRQHSPLLDMIHVVTTGPYRDDGRPPTQHRRDSDEDSQDSTLELEDPFPDQGGEWDWEFAELPQSAMLRLPTAHPEEDMVRTSNGEW